MNGEKVFLPKIVQPYENFVYKIMYIKKEEQMTRKKYLLYILLFNAVGLLLLFFMQLFQGYLFGNPQKLPEVHWALSFNTAISFVTNTNWQAYSGERSCFC